MRTGDNMLFPGWTTCAALGTNPALSTERSSVRSIMWKTGDKVRHTVSLPALMESRLSTIHRPYYKHYQLISPKTEITTDKDPT